MKHKIYILLMFVMLATGYAVSQTVSYDGTVYVEPLFKYPEAPDYMEDLTTRSDYLMDNFWNDMNFKQKSVSQNALVHAFGVYAAPMRWAQKAKVENSVKNLLKKLEKNPTLAIQFMKAAEETFHSPRSEVYIDDVYEMMLNGFIKNKKVKKDRKEKYEKQLAAMLATKPGNMMPALPLTDTVGAAVTPPLGSEFTIYIFGTARDYALRQLLLKLNTNLALERLCSDNRLSIVYVNTTPRDDEADRVITSLPAYVTAGYNPDAASTVDLRVSPSIYLLDATGLILNRNAVMEEAFAEIATRKTAELQSSENE